MIVNFNVKSQINKAQYRHSYYSDTIPLIGGIGGFHIVIDRSFLIKQDSIYLNKANCKIISFYVFEVGDYSSSDRFKCNSNKFTPEVKKMIKQNHINNIAFYNIKAIRSDGSVFIPKIVKMIFNFIEIDKTQILDSIEHK